jgi:phosphatidylserine/phosphatidylglycerophosphate/cardiolipin synthase-like enzyme
MHLKSYEIDGRVLHTGAANFSASGPKCQDNDLAVIMDTQAAAKNLRAATRNRNTSNNRNNNLGFRVGRTLSARAGAITVAPGER